MGTEEDEWYPPLSHGQWRWHPLRHYWWLAQGPVNEDPFDREWACQIQALDGDCKVWCVTVWYQKDPEDYSWYWQTEAGGTADDARRGILHSMPEWAKDAFMALQQEVPG